MEKIRDILLEKIGEADYVLAGIGEEFVESISGMEEDPEFSDALEKIKEREENAWMYPYLKKAYMDRHYGEKTEKAYGVLGNILEGKNYFIVSTRMDDYIYKTKLIKERIVTPCGGYRYCRCEEGCSQRLYRTDGDLPKKVCDYLMGGAGGEAIERPLCPVCGKGLVFNQAGQAGYIEEEYLLQWNKYMKWLQGTVNKKLCVLELGVGMKYPTVIRWPFEKVVFFNQKSVFFRVHSKLYQLAEEVKGRGYKIEKKPMDFLINGFV